VSAARECMTLKRGPGEFLFFAPKEERIVERSGALCLAYKRGLLHETGFRGRRQTRFYVMDNCV
jgi:hypothetical protein